MGLEVPIAAGIVFLILVVLVAVLARRPPELHLLDAAPRSSQDVLREVGVRGTGKVIFMQPTGKLVGSSKEFHVTLEVAPEVGRPYRVNIVAVVAPLEENRVRIGLPVPIRISPKNKTDVVLDVIPT